MLAGGRLRAVGTQQRLKHRFGSGYRLTLHLAPPSPAALEATAARAHAYVIRALSPSALLLSRVGSSMTYVLPRGTDVAAVFGALDSVRGASDTGIAEFGVQQASLEELGALADPPMTKDAIAGRIRRLLALADKRAQDLGIPDTESVLGPDMLEGDEG